MPLKIVIVGGVAGGMSAATRARRMNEKASITVLEKGGFISFANCGLPYYLGGQIAQERKLLITDPAMVKARFEIDVRVKHEVVRIDRAAKFVEANDLSTGLILRFEYDKLILATGATPIVPPVEHVNAANVFLLRSMEDTQAVHAWLEGREPKSALIVGAGFIGLEVAEAMRRRGLKVTVVEKAPHALPPMDPEMAQPIADELANHGVELIVGNGLKSLTAGADGLVSAVETEDGSVLPTDIVMLSIGVRPNVKLAQDAGLAIGPSRAIVVDRYQRTNDPDIYAVGDASQTVHAVTGQVGWIPLAGPANRQGRIAGEHAATGSSPASGRALGTAIVRVFGKNVGITGLSERSARAVASGVDSAYVLPLSHASYYPGAEQMRIKLVYEMPTGRVLGAQIVGGDGVDKRLDVIATVMHFGGTIDDLATLDLAYAPQFGSAKDAVHFAAFVAQNQLRGVSKSISPAELNGQQLVDVRTPQEHARGAIAGAKNIPLDELRHRANELDSQRPVVVYCQVGLRGYIAQRVLSQMGFSDVRNVKGGYTLAKDSRPDRVG